MARYIDADIMQDFLVETNDVDDWCVSQYNADWISSFIESQPTANVAEVKHGEWVRNEPNPQKMKEFHQLGIGKAMSENSIYWTCSCCGSWGTLTHKYCSQCGAKMDGGMGKC